MKKLFFLAALGVAGLVSAKNVSSDCKVDLTESKIQKKMRLLLI